MGYFHALKLAFLTSLIRKYVLWKGFYHDFSTKKVSASGGFAPWPPPRGSAPWTPARGPAPWTPEVTSPPLTIYPAAAPVCDTIIVYRAMWFKLPSFYSVTYRIYGIYRLFISGIIVPWFSVDYLGYQNYENWVPWRQGNLTEFDFFSSDLAFYYH